MDIGLASTDLLYYASGKMEMPGAMFTASHNPARYNGIKFCLSGARPVGLETGLADVKREAEVALTSGDDLAEPKASMEKMDLIEDYATHVRGFLPATDLLPLKVVADTANGMGGLVVPKVFEGLPFELTVLFGELDGSFPNHPADPIQPANLIDLKKAVLDSGADVGTRVRRRCRPRLFGRRTSARSVGVTYHGARRKSDARTRPGSDDPLQHHLLEGRSRDDCRVWWDGDQDPGGSFVHQAGDGRDERRLRRGAFRSLLLQGQLPGRLGNHRLDGRSRHDVGVQSEAFGAASALPALFGFWRGQPGTPRPCRGSRGRGRVGDYRGEVADRTDGLTVEHPDWWFNLRPSNTEPLLRLNVEARTDDECKTHVRQVIDLVSEASGTVPTPAE